MKMLTLLTFFLTMNTFAQDFSVANKMGIDLSGGINGADERFINLLPQSGDILTLEYLTGAYQACFADTVLIPLFKRIYPEAFSPATEITITKQLAPSRTHLVEGSSFFPETLTEKKLRIEILNTAKEGYEPHNIHPYVLEFTPNGNTIMIKESTLIPDEEGIHFRMTDNDINAENEFHLGDGIKFDYKIHKSAADRNGKRDSYLQVLKTEIIYNKRDLLRLDKYDQTTKVSDFTNNVEGFKTCLRSYIQI